MSEQWQKSSFSGVEGANCIELAHHQGRILIRESDTPADVLTPVPEGLLALIHHLRSES
ncbi:DUF397 domain-containing protein [Streptomyces adelaidensis]|uniref:DUF397 domain-containing protein n=1 Tax=Streptomyces adelaidensis TaxID=2796465 RepID=UPI001904B5F9|nr:DUF397 domain-containing protein [Streptomyces adelaidensis]